MPASIVFPETDLVGQDHALGERRLKAKRAASIWCGLRSTAASKYLARLCVQELQVALLLVGPVVGAGNHEVAEGC
jgi:hypothetical protein